MTDAMPASALQKYKRAADIAYEAISAEAFEMPTGFRSIGGQYKVLNCIFLLISAYTQALMLFATVLLPLRDMSEGPLCSGCPVDDVSN